MNKLKITQKMLALCIALIMIASMIPFSAIAAANYNGVDIALVIDDTISMQKSDPGKLTPLAIKKAVTASTTNRYAIAKYSLNVDNNTAKNLSGDKNAILDFADNNIKQDGSGTDAAAGVKWAVDQLVANSDDKKVKAVILIGDGENDFYGSRDEAASQADLTAAINDAKSKGIKVYTFAICNDSSKNTQAFEQYFESIANQTGGTYNKLVDTNDVDTKIDAVIKDLESQVQGVSVNPGEFHVNGNWQTSVITVPSNVFEMNLQCEFNKEPVEFKFTDPNGNTYDENRGVVFVQENNFNNYKISAPVSGDWTVEYRSDENQTVKAVFTFYSDDGITLSRTPDDLILDENIKYTAKISDRDGNAVTGSDLDGMEVELVVSEKDSDGNVINTIKSKMTRANDEFIIDNMVSNQSAYDIYAELTTEDGKAVKSNVFSKDFTGATKGGMPWWLIVLIVIFGLIVFVALLIVIINKAKTKPGSGPVSGFVTLKISARNQMEDSMIFPAEKFDCLQVFQNRNTLSNLVSAYVNLYRMNNTGSLAEMSLTQFINASLSEVSDRITICGNKKRQIIVGIPSGYDMIVDGMDVLKPRTITIGNIPEKNIEIRFKNQGFTYTVNVNFMRG